ncbi:MAG: tail fiber protein [Bacteroidota bacterium]|nr:tail fiber protein [Bacteroidota bacterium]
MEGVIGYTTMFAGNFAPKNWGFCQGQIMTIASNTALFSILGTTYGGNGTTTFGLPDLRGRAVVGAGQGPGLSPYSLGQMTGTENATLTNSEMPAHVHPVAVVAANPVTDGDASLSTANGSVYGRDTVGIAPYSSSSSVNMGPLTANLQMAPVGNSQALSILRPLLGINQVICMYGVYPARN